MKRNRWWGRTRIGVLTGLVAVAALGCYEPSAPAVDASCVATVRVNDLLYTLYAGPEDLPAGYAPGTPYATVTALRECYDVIVYTSNQQVESFGLEEGESNFLPAGTHLYAIDGFDPADRLAARHQDGQWIVVHALQN